MIQLEIARKRSRGSSRLNGHTLKESWALCGIDVIYAGRGFCACIFTFVMSFSNETSAVLPLMTGRRDMVVILLIPPRPPACPSSPL